MEVVEIISELTRIGASIEVENDTIKLTTSGASLSMELQQEIKSNKQEIISFIKALKAEKTIPKAPEKQYYPLSSAQRRMLFLQQLDEVSLVYNMPQIVRLEGTIDETRLTDAFQQLALRHESLRTSFKLVGEKTVQRIQEDFDFKIEYYKAKESEIDEVIQKFIRRFDLSRGPLIRAGLVKISEESHLLMVDMHHIISDGSSQGILINDFMAFYNQDQLPKLALQYKDFSEWQQSKEQQDGLAHQRNFWLQQFEEEVPTLDLPMDFSRPAIKSQKGANMAFSINEPETHMLKLIAEKEGATMYMTVLSLFNVLLSKLSNQEDITIGTPVAGRGDKNLEKIIGMFVNTVTLRNQPTGDISFRSFLKSVKENTLSCFDNQSFQYEELIEALQIKRDTSRNPLFDVMFVFQNFEEETLQMPGLQLKSYDTGHSVSKFDLTLSANEADGKLLLNIEYSTDLFEPATIERFISYFLRTASIVAEHPDVKLADVAVISQEEEHRLLKEFNDTTSEYPEDKTVIDLFEDQVELGPKQPALQFENNRLDYDAFHKKVNTMASSLVHQGVEQGDIVAIMSERSLDLMIGIFGILKAGAAYLPIDPKYPKDRIDYVLDNSHVQTVLVSSQFKSKIPTTVNTMSLALSDQASSDELSFQSKAVPEGLAYIIYTSGSTGKPKGVMVEHRSLMNRLYWMDKNYTLDNKDVVLQKTPIVFDVSVWELFWWSQKGASLQLLKQGDEKDPTMLCECIAKNKVSTMHFVPSMLQAFLDYVGENNNQSKLKSLRQVFASGEALNPAQVNTFNELLLGSNGTKLINLYGPTEATIDVSYYHCFDQPNYTKIPIGKPIDNIQLYILDKYHKVQPLGVLGELCIAGVGVSRGYLNNEALTAEKFIDNPYNSKGKLYRTGDLARWMPDGNIEFLGRLDDQVKIRGFRIELGEIESQIGSHPQIKEVVVLAKERDGDKYLAAYYSAHSEVESSELRQYLSTSLPEYMLPSFYIYLDEIPLTANGKANRRALPDPEITVGDDYVAPSNEIEQDLVEIWAEVLRLDKEVISVKKSFFEMGGHSLKATMLVNKISKRFNVEVSLRNVMTYQDVQSLGDFISKLEPSDYSEITKAKEKDYYVLSSAQRRLYFLYEFDKVSLAYNMPQVVRLEGNVDRTKLTEAFANLIRRHESLRTRFEMVDNEVYQRIQLEAQFDLEYFQSSELETPSIISKFIRPFDLGTGPLIRVGLIKQSDKSQILMVDIHHIIADGVSQGILIKDFMDLYSDAALSEITIEYKDYAEWQQEEHQQVRLHDQKEFWMNQFAEDLSVLDMQTDFTRPLVKGEIGSGIGFSLSEEETSDLRLLGEKHGATMFMTVLSMFNVLLSKLSNQEDVVIGTPVAGREHADLEGVMGMFVNTLALRNYPKGNLDFEQFLSEVQESTLSCFENQSYPFEELIEELNIARDTSRNPLFDVLFVFQNFEQEELILPGVTLSAYDSGHNISKFDLMLTATEAAGQLHLHFEYSTELYKESTIEKFVSYFKRVFSAVLTDNKVKLSEINLLSKEEEKLVLREFNQTDADYPKEKTMVQLFEEQVVETPGEIALAHHRDKLTYSELNQRANQIAVVLKEKGVVRHKVVGLMLNRSFDMIAAILGILKAGGICLPVDPSYPQKRIDHMLSNSDMGWLLVNDSTLDAEMNLTASVINVDTVDRNSTALENPVVVNESSDLLYVIYTSGSTGVPKGVTIKHSNLINLIKYQFDKTNIDFQSVLQFTTLNFDVSFQEIFSTLLGGGKLTLVDKATIHDFDKLLETVGENQISTLFMPASILNQIFNDQEYVLKAPRSIKHIVTAGEQIIVGQTFKDYLKKNRVYLHNHYGPSETHVITTMTLDPANEIPAIPSIGKPISNTEIYILDKFLFPQPINVPGEMFVAGAQLGKGYLNNKELTDERFLDHPFKSGEQIYRTGDLAKWRADGNIDFLGRADDQVKIRGFRITLGEIESQLSALNGINECLVIIKENEGEKYLVAYYVADSEIDTSTLRSQLAAQLPDYMIPTYYVHLDQLPLTPNGKVNRRILPDPTMTIDNDYVAPSNDIETQLVDIWSEILAISKTRIGVNSNFFDLGGHSLNIVKMNRMVNQKMGVEISVADIFRLANIAAMADFIMNGDQQIEQMQSDLDLRDETLDLLGENVLGMRDDE